MLPIEVVANRPATKIATGITKASRSCSPLRISSRASMSPCRMIRFAGGAGAGAGERSSAVTTRLVRWYG